MENKKMNLPVILLGAGGHARVLIDCLKLNGISIQGITSPDFIKGKDYCGLPLLGTDEYLKNINPGEVLLVNALGTVKLTEKRKTLYETWKQKGFSFLTLFHPSAVVSKDSIIEEGVQVMAGAVVQPGTRIGTNTIINTQASVDHDCEIGAHVHIAPGAILCGGVRIGDLTFIGTHASIVQGLSIGKSVMVAAGAVVTRSVSDLNFVAGIPARSISQDLTTR